MITICTLDAQSRCCNENCARCGFDLKEQKFRKNLLEKNGLTVGKNGLKRLNIKRKASEG